ncbi:MAG: DUF47 family protein [Candidatus Omnitrophica bacterium]|nr:DUF47 family protein [Candidatus Omnitrophota bacterium]
MFAYFSRFFKTIFQNRTDNDLQDLFGQYSNLVESCARELNPLFAAGKEERFIHAQRIARFKEEGDQLKRRLNEILDKSFIISWIDKAEATLLANGLDSCLRAMRRVAKHMHIYQIDSIRPQVRLLLNCIVHMAQEIPKMIEDLRNAHFDLLSARNPEIGKLESEADELYAIAVSALWQEESANPLTVIKWERIFQGLERITDHERDIADTMLSIARAAQ